MRAHQHLAGVDADPHLERRWPIVSAASAEGLLHAQGGPHGPLGVVLVGDRRAEQGDDGVAHDLVDLAAEAGDVLGQAVEAAVDEVLDLLRVEPLGQRR